MSFGARLAAWWHGAAFDAALAAGVTPDSDVKLAAHAARLARPHQVESLADGVERVLERAARPRQPISAQIPLRTSEVLAASEELFALAARLRTTPTPSPRALALTRRLLLDAESPLSNPLAAGTLKAAVREALLAFDADHEASHEGSSSE